MGGGARESALLQRIERSFESICAARPIAAEARCAHGVHVLCRPRAALGADLPRVAAALLRYGTIALAGLLAASWRPDRGLWPGWPAALIAGFSVLASLIVAADCRLALDFGLVTFVSLALCGIALAAARARSAEPDSASP